MTLEQRQQIEDGLRDFMESYFTIVGETDCHEEGCVILTSSGPKREGKMVSAIYSDPEEAAREFRLCLIGCWRHKAKLKIRRWPAVEVVRYRQEMDWLPPDVWYFVRARIVEQ